VLRILENLLRIANLNHLTHIDKYHIISNSQNSFIYFSGIYNLLMLEVSESLNFFSSKSYMKRLIGFVI